MTLRNTIAVCALISGIAAGSAFAADAPKMSKADMDKMTACKAMTMDAMKKDAGCMAMAKMHPDMMKAHMAPKPNMAPKKP